MKNIIILGATGGIGASLARSLNPEWNCFLVARNLTNLEHLALELQANFFLADCSDFNQVNQAFESAQQIFGTIHAVVNCCGSLLLKPAHLVSFSDYQQVLNQNLTTAFATVRSAGKYLSADGGSVVLISSAAASIGLANHEAISAAKGAINGLTISAATTYAGKNIRFNAVAPGLTRTPMTENIFSNEASKKISEKLHALRRLGEPEDIVNAIKFLISDQASWVTGQILGVDGGLGSLRSQG